MIGNTAWQDQTSGFQALPVNRQSRRASRVFPRGALFASHSDFCTEASALRKEFALTFSAEA